MLSVLQGDEYVPIGNSKRLENKEIKTLQGGRKLRLKTYKELKCLTVKEGILVQVDET